MKSNSLVNLLVDEKKNPVLKNLEASMPDIILNDRQICDFELLTTGLFFPLKGFV